MHPWVFNIKFKNNIKTYYHRILKMHVLYIYLLN